MKNKLIKVIALTLTSAVIASSSSVMAEDDIKIFVNDKQITTDASPVIEDDRTLVPIRVISENLNREVNWIAEENTVEIKEDSTVLRLPIGEEMYTLNGMRIMTDVPAKIINDRAFVPIRLVAKHFDCNVVWDEEERAVYVSNFPKYNEGSLDELYILGIIDKEDLNSGEYITTREALNVFRNICGGKPSLQGWYYGDILEPLDYLDDSDKELLLSLSYILPKEDMLDIKLDENATNYDALKYTVRILGNTYGCDSRTEEISFTEKSQTYDRAYEKGLIDKADTENADLPIKREDFYKLIYKSLFVEYSSGSAAGVHKYKRINSIFEKNENKKHTNKKDIVTEKTEIPTRQISADVTFNDDMSVSWTVSDEYRALFGEKCNTTIELYTADDEELSGVLSSVKYDVSAKQLIKAIVSHYPKKADYMRVTYEILTDKYSVKEKYFFDIDMPKINVLVEGEEINPGIFIPFDRKWVPQMVTLADGQSFKKDAYYLITSYSHKYRKDEYNHSSSAIWRAEETSNVFKNTTLGPLLSGGLDLDDMHIQEITVKGDSKSGFTLSVTPESKNIFKVKKN